MKKFLLSCFLALGIGANAQYNYTGTFEDPGYNTNIYKQFGGGSRTAAAACNGAFGGQLAMSASTTSTGFMIDLSTISQTGNGQKMDVTVNYKKAANVTGTFSLAYFILDPQSQLWSIVQFGTPVALTAPVMTTCSVLSGTIPAGVIEMGKTIGVGVWVTRSGSGNGNVFVDDIQLVQENVSTLPTCTTVTYPANGSTISGGNVNFNWSAVPTAIGYKVKVGTSPGASDVVSQTVNGGANHVNLSIPVNGNFYFSVTPYNLNGDAVGCTESTFSTNAQINYCGPITSSVPGGTYPITSVAVNTATANTSSATVGSPAYEDFSSVIFDVPGANVMTLNVKGVGLGTNRFGMTVFIDWNNNGSFNDAGEQYFTTAPFVGGTGAATNFTNSILVPDGVTGHRRMRIKYNFNSSTTSVPSALADPCGEITNGQVEDYTLNVTPPSTVPGCTTLINPVEGSTVPANSPITWNAVPNAGKYKIYLGTTAGGSEVLNGVEVSGSTTSYTAALTVGTTYYVRVIPSNSLGEAAGCTEVSFTAGPLVYCGPLAYASDVEPITHVIFSGIDKTSPVTSTISHEMFLDSEATVSQGQTYPISINGTTGGDFTSYYVIFIDWNQNGNLNDPGEVYYADGSMFQKNTNGTTSAPVVKNIAVPQGAKVGNTRMRIKKEYYGSVPAATTNFANPCINGGGYGQAEDYTVIVEASVPECTTISAPADAAVDVAVDANLTWAAVTGATGYKVFIGTTAGGTEVVNGTEVSGTSFAMTLANNTQYYAKVVPTNNGTDAVGCTEISFTTVAAAVTYCGPLSYNTVEPTTNVTFEGINNTTSAVLNGTPAHEFFLDQTAQVEQGGTYTISMNANTDGASFRHYFAVFIDWNQDGDFDDAGEKYFVTTGNFVFVLGSNGVTGTPATGSIAVPASAKLGKTRMRVKSAFYATGGPTGSNLTHFANACVTTGSTYGQVEDYSVNVSEATMGVSATNKDKVSLYPNPFTEVLKISDVKDVKTVIISDMAGRQIGNMKAKAELSLGHLASGTYMVTLVMENGTKTSYKVIKK